MGAAIGFERSFHGRPAGFRTHILVCMASSLLMLVTVYQNQWFTGASIETIRIDPTRMAQGVMTGIGFLGAGVIVKEGLSVKGLTTAASIWVTAAIGIVCGIGLYLVAIVGTVATFLILSLFRWIEAKMPKLSYAHHSLKCKRNALVTEDELREIITHQGISIANLSYSIVNEGTCLEYGMTLQTKRMENFRFLSNTLSQMETVIEYSIVPTGD